MGSEKVGVNFNTTMLAEADFSTLLRWTIVKLEADLSGVALQDWTCLGIGYCILAGTVGAILVGHVVWKICRNQVFRQQLRNQGGIIREAFADLSRQTFAQASYSATMTKVVFILFLELAFLPTLYGCWVDFCVLPLFGANWRERLLWFYVSPISFCLMHWAAGMASLIGTATFLSLLRKELRPGSLPFFRDPFEREDEPIRDMVFLGFGQQIERQICSLGFFACVAVIALHIPLKLAKLGFLGSVVPLRLTFFFSDPEVPTSQLMQSISLVMYHCVFPLTISRIKTRVMLMAILRFWLKYACKILDLSDLLLRQNGDNVPAIIPHGLNNEMNEDQRSVWRREMDAAKAQKAQIGGLLISLMTSIVAFNTAFLVLPVHTGRQLLRVSGLEGPHDLMSFSIGIYALWAFSFALTHIYKPIASRSAKLIGKAIWRWIQVGSKLAVFGFLGLGALPVIIGLFFEHCVLPIRLANDSSPAFFLYSDWASGLIFLRTLYTHILHPRNLAANREPRNMLQTKIDELRQSLRHAQQIGVTNISLSFGCQKILLPIFRVAGFLLAFPYIITKGILPRIPGISSEIVQISFRNAWWVELVSIVLIFLAKFSLSKFAKYRAGLRDRLYLERRELMDLTPETNSQSVQ